MVLLIFSCKRIMAYKEYDSLLSYTFSHHRFRIKFNESGWIVKFGLRCHHCTSV